MSRSADSRSRVGLVAAFLVAVIAAVHLQQYVDFISEVRTVGVLFVLNAAGGAGLAVALTGNFLGYSEPTLRLPILIAITAEVAALPVLVVLVTAELRLWRAGQGVFCARAGKVRRLQRRPEPDPTPGDPVRRSFIVQPDLVLHTPGCSARSSCRRASGGSPTPGIAVPLFT